MLCRRKVQISMLLIAFFVLSPALTKGQEASDSTIQDPKRHAISEQIDRIVEDILDRVDQTMRRYWNGENETEEEEFSSEKEGMVSKRGGESGTLVSKWSTRSRSLLRKYGVRYPLHWSSRVSDLEPLIFRYNRVEGIFLGLGSAKRHYWEGEKNFSVYGSVGYGFKTHRWRYGLGVDRWFSDAYRFEVGVEGHSLTDTKDDWFMRMGENTLAALFVREDYHDFFGREGFSFHGAQYFTRAARLRVDYVWDEYKSLTRNTEWALFGGDRRFRLNPAINNGRMRSVIVSFDMNRTTERRGRLNGWNIHTSAEFAGGDLGGDFTFNRYLLEVRRAQPLSRYDKVNFRLRVGSSQGDLPLQKTFELGGIGTLNAFRYKEFSGNRMILGNVEYILSGSALKDLSFWPSSIFRNVTIILFADAGMTKAVSPHQGFLEGFGTLTRIQWKSDIGFALGTNDGTARLAFAWRTDGKAPAKIFIRLDRPF